MSQPRHLTFDVTKNEHGSYTARCRELDISAEGNTPEEISDNVHEAVRRFFADESSNVEITLTFDGMPRPT